MPAHQNAPAGDLERALARAAARPSPRVLRTARLVLRPWREDDKAPFAALNADPEVMRFFPTPLTTEESDALVERFRASTARDGFGVWAVQHRESGAFLGAVGPQRLRHETPAGDAVELLWRLNRAAWGQGYATEAATAALRFALDELGLPEVVAMTPTVNEPSWRVMERLGMAQVTSFVHPAMPANHPLQPCVLYVARAEATLAPEPTPAPAAKATLPKVWVDGDGCPRAVKDVVFKAAQRGACEVTVIANHAVPVPNNTRVTSLVVSKGLDVADDELVARAQPADLVITADVPLSAELVAKGVAVLSPHGQWSTPSNIGEKLSLRDFFTEARAAGLVEGGGPPPFDERARKAFADALSGWITRRARELAG